MKLEDVQGNVLIDGGKLSLTQVLAIVQSNRICLDHLNFAGQDGAGVNWFDIRAAHAVFKGANLRGAVFRWCNLENADFSDADLTNAEFARLTLRGACFKGAKLQGVRFERVYLNFWDRDLIRAVLLSAARGPKDVELAENVLKDDRWMWEELLCWDSWHWALSRLAEVNPCFFLDAIDHQRGDD